MKKLLLLLLLVSTNILADIAAISYTSPAGPTGRANDTELLQEDIAGYKVYVNSIYFTTLASDVTVFTHEVKETTTFNMVTVDTEGRESMLSNIVTANGNDNPDAPTITITISIKAGPSI